MMDLKKLIEESYQIAKEHGWHDPEPTFEEHITNIHTELGEAWQEWRNKHQLDEIYRVCRDGCHENEEPFSQCMPSTCKKAKPCGIPIELADVVIRSCDTLGTFPICWDLERRSLQRDPQKSLSSLINLCHYLLGVAEEKYWKIQCEYLYTVIKVIEQFCNENSIDLDRAIELKTAYNRTREHRHGGKRV